VGSNRTQRRSVPAPERSGPASSLVSLQRDDATGVWSTTLVGDRSGTYYTYLVDVHVDGTGVVRNLVADPYAISLTTDSRRAYVAELNSPSLLPPAGVTRRHRPECRPAPMR